MNPPQPIQSITNDETSNPCQFCGERHLRIPVLHGDDALETIPAEIRSVILGCVLVNPHDRMTTNHVRQLLKKWLNEAKRQTSSRMDHVGLLAQVRALGVMVYHTEEVEYEELISNSGAAMAVFRGSIITEGKHTEVA